MKKKMIAILSLFYILFCMPIDTQAAHIHSDDCYTGEKHYHTNPCKKIVKSFDEFPFPNENCRTCGGDGFVESDCGGALDYIQFTKRTPATRVHVLYNDVPHIATVGYSSFDMITNSLGKLYCTQCNHILYEGNPYEFRGTEESGGFSINRSRLRKQDGTYYSQGGQESFCVFSHPFYSTFYPMVNFNSQSQTVSIRPNQQHTFSRCPDCVGETYTCSMCNGNSSYKHPGGEIAYRYPCPGKYIRGEIILHGDHTYIGSTPESYGPQTLYCYKSETADAAYCSYCQDISFANRNLVFSTSLNGPSDVYHLSDPCPTHGGYAKFTVSSVYYKDLDYTADIVDKVRNEYYDDGFRGLTRHTSFNYVGTICSNKFGACQYCYQGGQTEIYVCGCDTYNYYDINKNVTPDVCDKVVSDIAVLKL